MRFGKHKSLRLLQEAFQHGVFSEAYVKALSQTITQRLWAKCESKEGIPFETFADWVTYDQPEGLGVNNQMSADFLRKLLLSADLLPVWAEVFRHIRTRPGRPKTIAEGENSTRIY